MHTNRTMLCHPETIRKIKAALWIARLEACKTKREGRQYVANRKGHNFLRVSVYPCPIVGQEVRIWGDQSRDITAMVLSAIHTAKGRN